ncbi:hypothetical protein BU23DRAFT_557347 [Bimuria novae-zelandiae CBS 107.79]|uniref:Uncharacterized protein n=1 Tax=Bimuria novae-zelandiae CBS 107.79 TaxID=1447943 RepID=A0A6A5V8S9_9PLEO|nr:hypothetical protein BU23DRAFT_557347 [Bimuria novae-zelandiae CBS 107.79]
MLPAPTPAPAPVTAAAAIRMATLTPVFNHSPWRSLLAATAMPTIVTAAVLFHLRRGCLMSPTARFVMLLATRLAVPPAATGLVALRHGARAACLIKAAILVHDRALLDLDDRVGLMDMLLDDCRLHLWLNLHVPNNPGAGTSSLLNDRLDDRLLLQHRRPDVVHADLESRDYDVEPGGQ